MFISLFKNNFKYKLVKAIQGEVMIKLKVGYGFQNQNYYRF